jgi:hypothetical protein
MSAGRAAAAAGQSGLMALYDRLFGMMDVQAARLIDIFFYQILPPETNVSTAGNCHSPDNAFFDCC